VQESENLKKQDTGSLSTSRFPRPLCDWMEQFVSFPVPEETRAACGDCPMLKEPPLTHAVTFSSKARCCTYIPKLSNFQVGAIFLDDDRASAMGRERVAARLSSRRGVTPLGIFPDAQENSDYQALGEEDGFGQTNNYICPYHAEGDAYGCSIWKYRSSTCSTWFCRHVRGAFAKDFWKKLYRLLEVTERQVRYQCLVEMNLSPKALARLLPPVCEEKEEDLSSDEAFLEIWGPWLGRERDFYQACAEYVDSLTWKDIKQFAGPELAIRMRQFADAEFFLQQDILPEGLVPGRFYAADFAGRPEITRVVSYLKTDVLHLPTSVMMMLHLFDGRSTAEILKSAAHRGLDEKTVRTLYDFRILTTDGKAGS
jgi:hypothetical protein